MTTIQHNLTAVMAQIDEIAQQCDRDSKEIKLLAVSKTKPVSAIEEAIDAGQRLFGENYVQEGVEKIHYFADKSISADKSILSDKNMAPSLEWHFIGPLQSNKTRLVAENFDWIHTVEREKIAQRLNDQRPAHLAPLNTLIQINIDHQPTKSGIEEQALFELAALIDHLPNLTLRGIMVIPAPQTETEKQLHTFQHAAALYQQLKLKYDSVDTLSMGMSDDMPAAIMAGTTMVRIGTAIFGARHYD